MEIHGSIVQIHCAWRKEYFANVLRRYKKRMSLQAVGSSQNSITLDWAGINDNEDTQYILKMKDRIRKWITVYSGHKTQTIVRGLYSGEAYQFQLTLQTKDGNVLYCSPEIAFATKEEHQSLAHLHRAVKAGNIAKVQKFLRTKGQAIDAFDQWGRSSLMVSTWHGHGELVGVLLANGADVNLLSCELGQTTLMVACSRGYADIVQQLADRGASWDTKDKNGCTALMYAVDASHMTCLEIALESGADVDARDNQGWTPLMRAVMLECSLPIIEKLLDQGANVSSHDNRNVTSLMLAVLSGRVEVVKVLLSRGADSAVKDIYSNTALDMATTKHCQGIIDLLKAVAIKKEKLVKPRLIRRSMTVSAATTKTGVKASTPALILTGRPSGSPKINQRRPLHVG